MCAACRGCRAPANCGAGVRADEWWCECCLDAEAGVEADEADEAEEDEGADKDMEDDSEDAVTSLCAAAMRAVAFENMRLIAAPIA